MSTTRFHEAAQNGLLDVLNDITRKEANAKDVDGMTPVLLAAFSGHQDALRLLVERGGDPDNADQFGNTALHLAAAKGHFGCVQFLIKFGVNLYALDIDKHNAKDLATINNQIDILTYLETAIASLESKDKKKAKAFRETAEKVCEKRMKEYSKKQQRLEQEYENVKTFSNKPTSVLTAIKHKIWASSQGTLKQKEEVADSKFSDLVGISLGSKTGSVQKKAYASKLKQHFNNRKNIDIFKAGEPVYDRKQISASFMPLQADSDSISGSISRSGISNVSDLEKQVKVYHTFDDEAITDIDRENHELMSRSFSYPNLLDFQNSNENEIQKPCGLFDRPMPGSIAFRRSVTVALNQLHPEESSIGSPNSRANFQKNSTTKSRGSKQRRFLTISDSDSEGISESDDDPQDNGNAIHRFLAVWGLEEHLHIFEKQQIDLDTLMLLTEGDLRSLLLPLGPFRKLVIAIQERKNALANPGTISDSRL